VREADFLEGKLNINRWNGRAWDRRKRVKEQGCLALSKEAMDKVDIYLNELKLCVLGGVELSCNFEHGANDVMARISEVPSRTVK